MDIERVIELAIQDGINIGVAQTMKVLGVSAGELSERQAKKTYGKWFIEAIERKAIEPCRVGDGRTGTKWYSVTEILAYKARKEVKAAIRY